MNTYKTVTAVFVASTATYNLTINISGSGTVTKSPDQSPYLTGTTVKLTATPDQGYIFDHWSGDISGTTNIAAINMNTNDKTVTAVFTPVYTLNVIADTISGNVAINPIQTIYKIGTSVSLYALPNPGFAFDNWSGSLTGNTNPVTITMDSNKTITANYVTSTARFTLNTTTSGSGIIAINPNTTDYLTGSIVTLTAKPNSGNIFDHWEGDVTGNTNPININMNTNKAVTAVFIGPRGTLSGTVTDSLGGSPVSDAIITINSKTTVTNANGNFIIINIPIGTYDVNVSKDSRAGSKLQAVDILDGQTTNVELISPIYDFSSSQTTPPTISVTGLTKGNSYSSTIPITPVPITINVIEGSNPIIGTGNHSSIYLKFGSDNNKNQGNIITSATNSLTYDWYPDIFPPGNLNIKIVSYDINNNRSELIINFSCGCNLLIVQFINII